MLTLEKFEEASEVVKKVAIETKLLYSPYFSEKTGNKVYLKPENMQVTGAYKIRGAYYKISTLTEEERQTMLCLLNAERAHLARRLSWWKRPLFRYLWGVPTDTGPDKEDTTDAQP